MQSPLLSKLPATVANNNLPSVANPIDSGYNTSSTPLDTRPQFLLSIKQVCLRCSLSRSTIYAFIKRGQFPQSYAVGARARRFLETEIDSWIDQQVRK